jgi:hypothetical protein
MLTGNLNMSDLRILSASQAAAQQAINEDNRGVDPTNGAEHFNMRPTNTNAVNPALGEPPTTMILGPFHNSYNNLRYIDIYP